MVLHFEEPVENPGKKKNDGEFTFRLANMKNWLCTRHLNECHDNVCLDNLMIKIGIQAKAL